MSRVLSVSDVAGVGASLNDALSELMNWETHNVAIPSTLAGTRGVQHAVGALTRAVRIPGAVRGAVRRFEPDVVHLHWARFVPFLPPSARPLVVHCHGSDVRNRSSGPAGRLVRSGLERADAVLAATPDLLEHLPSDATWLPNPVDVDLFRPPDLVSRSSDRRRVLVFARLTDVKGGAELVELGRDLLRWDPTLEVVGFAGGSYDAAARGAGMKLHPPTDRRGVADLVRTADLVVGQQRIGTYGLSELEAMACARPVVAFVRDEFKHPTLPICSPRSPAGESELFDMCVDLLDDEARRHAIGRAGRRFVERVHSPPVVVSQLVDVYERVMSS